MAANTSPIFTAIPNVGAAAVGGTANTRSDGVGTIATDIYKAFTAGTNGAFVQSVRLQPVSSVAATTTTATVIRIFVSNKTSGATTQADTFLVQEVTAGAQTADHSTNSTAYIEVPLNIPIPASWTILISSHVINATNTSWQATVFGGDY